ncbi:unnamed protein product [Cylindrotheca closterium]|uniref:GST N-terminal domain-containing protein n=1 Tax=Cylindrotheca closterium TaxID=2856 RepID=A0AAD2CQ12_9STRA|nr:unnamed protein product [Cylindrotheca closterium]
MDRILSSVASKTRGSVGRAAAHRTSPVPPNHDLILYEYEASPWCRIVREYLTILDLKAQIRPCPRQTLFMEGAYDKESRFRPEAMQYLKSSHQTDDMTFPILVDRTKAKDSPEVIVESYAILEHLWQQYGQSVEKGQNRPDQWWNSPSIPFPIRFLSLAGPSYLRPFPSCGILKTPSTWDNGTEITLYQAEGCPESRLVRETLCTLEIPYLSIAAGINSSNSYDPVKGHPTPILEDGTHVFYGASECNNHLWKTYKDPSGMMPRFWNMLSDGENLGRAGSWGVGAYTAFLKGARDFVPQHAMK